MSFSVSGKTAIVTGAANGVGLAIAQRLVSEGANVMFADMDDARLEEELGDLHDEGNARWFAGDLREKLTLANLLSATLDAFERVDILVNASRQAGESDPLDAEADGMVEMLNQNLVTALRLSQLVGKRMIKQAEGQEEGGAGAIVNLSSIAARRTRAELLAYSVSTAALDQMTRTLAVAMAPHRIRVNAVAMGSVMSASLQTKLRKHADFREDIVGHTPLHRIAGPGAVASAVQFLVSDAAAFITGEVLTVDGGRSLIDAVSAPTH